MPAYTVILAWVHAAKIIENNREYLDREGYFVVLCPETRVVGGHKVTYPFRAVPACRAMNPVVYEQ